MASIIKRKKNYSVVYNYVDENGETKQKWETWHTHKEALKRKAEVENQQNNGTIPSSRIIRKFQLFCMILFPRMGRKNGACLCMTVKQPDCQLYQSDYRRYGSARHYYPRGG